MPAGESLDDDYVIALLTKDADANKKRYLSSGLGPLLSKRRSENAPKPNTRFLKNVIRDVDAHNTALKTKEEEEAATRLRGLQREQSSGKRKREGEGEAERGEKRRRGEEKEGRWARALGGLGERASKSDSKRRNASGRRAVEEPEVRSRRIRSRSRSRERGERGERAGQSVQSERSKSRRDRKHHDRHEGRRSNGQRPRSPSRRKQHSHHTRDDDSNDDNLSDPLDDVIGPKPPPKVRPRGRGAYKNTPSMDTKFDPNYNPKTDVDLAPDDGERDEWDMALEALRDRAKWRASGGERLRRAGFSDAEVKKWEGDSGLPGYEDVKGEKEVEDVRWRKRGEAREWDQGKMVGKDGDVELKASWA